MDHSSVPSNASPFQAVPDFQDIFDNAPIGIYTSTPDGRFLAANPAMASMFGFDSPQDLIASVTNIAGQLYVDPADRDEFKRLVEEQGEVKDQEFRMVRRDGTVVWVSRSGRGVRDSEGNIVQYQGFITDLSDRKWKESEIKNTQSQYQSLVENIPGIAFRCKYDNYWTMLYMSEQALDLTGYPAGEFIQNTVRAYSSVIHPEDRPLVVKSIADAVASGRPWDIHYRVCHKDGKFRWVHEKGRGVPQKDGVVAHLDGFILNITERKQAEEALRNSEERLGMILNNISDNVWSYTTDCDGNFISSYISPAGAKFLGITEDELNHSFDVWFSYVLPEDLPMVKQAMADTIATGKGRPIDYRVKTADGSIKWIQSVGNRIYDQEGIFIFVGTGQDITLRKEYEQALQESEERYRTLFESTINPVMIIDNKGNYIDANEAAMGFLDCSRNKLLKKNVVDFLPPAKDQMMEEHVSLWDIGGVRETEYFVNGQVKTLILAITPGTWLGQPVIFGNGTDITDRKQAEESLRESEYIYRGLSEDMPVMVCRFLPDLTLTYVNKAYCAFFGKTPEELIGVSYLTLIPEADHEGAYAAIAALNSTNPVTTYDHQVLAPDGSIHWQRWIDRALFDDQGNIFAYQAVGEDITERKLTEQALHEQRKLEKILTTLAIGFINVPLARVDDALNQMLETVGMFTRMDRVYVFQHDASRAVTVNTHEWCADGVTPEIGNLQAVPLDLLQYIQNTLQEGETVLISDVSSIQSDHDLRAHFEDQGIKSFVAIPLMQGVKNVGFVGFDAVKAKRTFSESELNILKVLAQIVSNILERLEAEKALQTSEQRYRDYILNTPYGLFIADKIGRFLFVNPAACTLSEHSDEELLSMKVSDLLTIEARKSSLKHFREVIRKGRAKGEYEMLSKSGDKKWWSVTSVKISNDRFLVFCHDITLRKQAEDQMRLMSTTDDLTGLWNRRYFMQALAREMDRAMRYGQVFSVLLMDIDHFKRINDGYGHDIGDKALRHFSATIQNGLRQVDVLGRLGGEEFGIILPQTDLKGAFSIAERLRKKLERSPFYINDKSVFLTVSIGLATWDMYINMDEILKMADDALYKAKSCGRNQTVKHVCLST